MKKKLNVGAIWKPFNLSKFYFVSPPPPPPPHTLSGKMTSQPLLVVIWDFGPCSGNSCWFLAIDAFNFVVTWLTQWTESEVQFTEEPPCLLLYVAPPPPSPCLSRQSSNAFRPRISGERRVNNGRSVHLPLLLRWTILIRPPERELPFLLSPPPSPSHALENANGSSSNKLKQNPAAWKRQQTRGVDSALLLCHAIDCCNLLRNMMESGDDVQRKALSTPDGGGARKAETTQKVPTFRKQRTKIKREIIYLQEDKFFIIFW